MIKTFCDRCGAEISNADDIAEVTVHCYKLLGVDKVELHMHLHCATEVIGAANITRVEAAKKAHQAKLEAYWKANGITARHGDKNE